MIHEMHWVPWMLHNLFHYILSYTLLWLFTNNMFTIYRLFLWCFIYKWLCEYCDTIFVMYFCIFGNHKLYSSSCGPPHLVPWPISCVYVKYFGMEVDHSWCMPQIILWSMLSYLGGRHPGLLRSDATPFYLHFYINIYTYILIVTITPYFS